MVETKKLLLRMEPELAEQLQAMADVEGRPMSELVREAIRSLIEAKRSDPQFQRRLRDSARDHERTLRALRSLDDA